ncbi:MAG: hypothetical protein CMP80_05590 [Formosa sp.]|nr:hypothetical protein [Formosa sp.]|tara:strand:- start:4960 stop:6180 length:1221 start_codon:yes stop_codon:yes gene_type:complete
MMRFNFIKNTALFIIIFLSCENIKSSNHEILVGANQLEIYLPKLKNKSIGIVANQTSVIFKKNAIISVDNYNHKKSYTHLVDSLIKRGVNIKKVFSPEHGYRGASDAGEYVSDNFDKKTGLPIVSLYGKNRIPNPETLKGLDIIIFDIQDIGTRFYTFISTLHYMMEACANLNIPMILLDRPNPNISYVDGPVLDMKYKSFVGMHPVPIVHGMTIGEFAKMINGEGWLEGKLKCDLTVVPVMNYSRKTAYSLPIKPSPNLPNDKAINLYPSLCLFEGTNVSIGRGTEMQFQIFGSPYLNTKNYKYKFIPISNFGAKNPKFKNKMCFGENLENNKYLSKVNLSWIINAYENTSDKSMFFNSFFTKLAGQIKLQHQIENGYSISEIKSSWEEKLILFKKNRSKYLIYH